MTILVSIISEQTIPNYLIAKNFPEADYHLFLVTKQTIPQYHWLKFGIEKHLLKKVLDFIEISNDDYFSNINNLENNNYFSLLKNANRIIMNITGGTKIMAFSAIEYFRKNFSEKIEIVYLPINSKEIVSLSPKLTKQIIKLSIKNIHEYLNVLGFKYIGNYLDKDKYYRAYDHSGLVLKLNEANKLYNDFKIHKSNWTNYLNEIGYKDGNAGEFLESLLYHKIKADFNLSGEQLLLNLKIYFNQNASNDYEFDVVFLYENSLHLVEAKINLSGLKSIIKNYSGIKSIFGLNTRSYIFTLREYQNKEHFQYMERFKSHGILGIFDMNEVNEILEKNINLKKVLLN
jgi:DNA-binding protein